MAIIRTTFTGITSTDNAAEVLAWLQTNATEYFDTISADLSGNISCQIGAKTVFFLAFDGSSHSFIKTVNNSSATDNYVSACIFSYAIKTNKGIHLISAASDGQHETFITKSDVNTTAILFKIFTTSQSTSFSYKAADFVHSPSIFSLPYNASAISASCTSLAHIVFSGGFYAPHLYAAHFSQYPNTTCIFEIGNTKYSSNGYIVLSD